MFVETPASLVSGRSRMSRTDWLVPIDLFHPHEQKPSSNFMVGSLVRENRRKIRLNQIRVHPIGKNAKSVPSPTIWPN
ncbi:hypothetical protein LINPERPRIM_LOCUS470 [Linum perenne]